MSTQIVADPQAELVRRCLDGERTAQGEFVRLFQNRVFALCLKLIRNRHDAEDVAQESLVRALKYLNSWDPTRALVPWVLKIASNRCRTHLSRRGRLPVATGEPNLEVPAELPEIGLAEEIDRGLLQLRDDHRHCFVLFYQQELSVAEVAEAMDIPQGTVKTWLFRARKEMAEYLRSRGYGEEEA
ncbi:MAG: RNA polymerase sigma factor [Planctomycetaceae bacterium]|nr:RNA polymerase sigma factor [Planctomycetaceae bacterium]